MTTMGVNCVACPDGTGTYCLETLVEDISADWVDIDLLERTQTDINNDPNCVSP